MPFNAPIGYENALKCQLPSELLHVVAQRTPEEVPRRIGHLHEASLVVPGGLVAAGRRDRPDGHVRPHCVQTNDARLVWTVRQVLGTIHVVMFMAK